MFAKPLHILLPPLLAASCIAGPVDGRHHARAGEKNRLTPVTLPLGRTKYDLTKKADLEAMVRALDRIVGKETADSSSDDVTDRDEGALPRKHAKEIRRIARAMLDRKEPAGDGIQAIQEVAWAARYKAVRPWLWRDEVDVLGALVNLRDVLLNPVGRGSRANPATNLATYSGDLSRVDPKPSTFWARPADIPARDLYYGFDRTELPGIAQDVCTYDRAHTGYGEHASLYVKWKGERWRTKYGEEHTEPFASRIFWALGYPALVTDFAPEVKIRWDRRILTEFNSRRTNAWKLTFAAVPIARFTDKEYLNPFNYIQYGVLTDGSRVPSAQLRRQLFRGKNVPRRPERNANLYDTDFESRIDYLVMKEAEVNGREESSSLGSWDFNALGHDRLREVRALAVLCAWLDNWDVRWNNNRLNLVKDDDGQRRLQHVVSDVGTAFGNSSGLIRMNHGKLLLGPIPDAPNLYAWSFTRPLVRGQQSVPIHDFMPITRVEPFYELNIDDARWAARLIARLTEEQLKQALVGAGYDAATGRLLLEKLVSRRDRMIQDFGLAGEIKLLRPNGVNQHLSYNPRTDGPFAVTLRDGAIVTARAPENLLVQDGKLVSRTREGKRHAGSSRTGHRVQRNPARSSQA